MKRTDRSAGNSWWVTADDRTGAREVAAQLASSGRSVPVVVWADGPPSGPSDASAPSGPVVFDLGTRQLDGAAAVDRLREVCELQVPRAHKIDSMLRGHWAAEVGVLARHRRVLIVPSAPLLGRTCVDGVVHVHGRRLANGELKTHIPEVQWLPSVDSVAAWLSVGDGIACCADVSAFVDDGSLPADVVIVGPAFPIGVALRHRPHVPAPLPRRPDGSVVVVCGSASPVARRQLEVLTPDVQVFSTAPPAGADPALDVAVVRRLADQVRSAAQWRTADVVVIVGGDTAAALLGDETQWVGGDVRLGMPWSMEGERMIITKAGAFGDEHAVADAIEQVVQNG